MAALKPPQRRWKPSFANICALDVSDSDVLAGKDKGLSEFYESRQRPNYKDEEEDNKAVLMGSFHCRFNVRAYQGLNPGTCRHGRAHEARENIIK